MDLPDPLRKAKKKRKTFQKLAKIKQINWHN